MRTMFDAAYLPDSWKAVDIWAGYIPSSNAYHVWSNEDWTRAKASSHGLLPIYVYSRAWSDRDAPWMAENAVQHAMNLGMPKGVALAIDVEAGDAVAYGASGFGRVWTDRLLSLGVVPLAYTSSSTREWVDKRQLKWLAEYHNDRTPFMVAGADATQWTNALPGEPYDQSLVLDSVPFWGTYDQGGPTLMVGQEGFVAIEASPTGGYYIVKSDGGVYAYGGAVYHGGANVRWDVTQKKWIAGPPLVKSIVDISVTSTGRGYFLLGEDGGVFAYGDAKFEGRP